MLNTFSVNDVFCFFKPVPGLPTHKVNGVERDDSAVCRNEIFNIFVQVVL